MKRLEEWKLIEFYFQEIGVCIDQRLGRRSDHSH